MRARRWRRVSEKAGHAVVGAAKGAPLGVGVGAGDEAVEGGDDGAELMRPIQRKKTTGFVELKLHSVLDARDNTQI